MCCYYLSLGALWNKEESLFLNTSITGTDATTTGSGTQKDSPVTTGKYSIFGLVDNLKERDPAEVCFNFVFNRINILLSGVFQNKKIRFVFFSKLRQYKNDEKSFFQLQGFLLY